MAISMPLNRKPTIKRKTKTKVSCLDKIVGIYIKYKK